MQVPLMRLQCGCNSYEWGKVGNTSAAAKLASATGFTVQEDKPYAELWMGTHPSLPSKDLATGRTLLDLVQDNNALLNHDVARKYGNKLPFLFKVLSISKALSIQAHPNKKLAEQLFERDSKNYPDDNHKPEMTIAVTPFDGLCGFRPLGETVHFLKTVPSLRQLVGDAASKEFEEAVTGHETASDAAQAEKNKKALQTAFTALLRNGSSSPDALKPASDSLVASARELGADFASGGGPGPNNGKQLSELIIRLNGQFPGDIGLFVLFFLNYIQLDVGEAMFLKADDIHAYLSGDIVECMANSDNVVRAGFTPKFRDVDTMTEMLTYSYAPIEEQKMQPQDYAYVKLDRTAYSANSSSILYDPPIEEFAVVKTDLKANGAKATFESIAGPSIIICTAGRGTITVGPKTEEVETGYVYFVGATAECILESKGDEDFTTFKAFCELEEEKATTNGKM